MLLSDLMRSRSGTARTQNPSSIMFAMPNLLDRGGLVAPQTGVPYRALYPALNLTAPWRHRLCGRLLWPGDRRRSGRGPIFQGCVRCHPSQADISGPHARAPAEPRTRPQARTGHQRRGHERDRRLGMGGSGMKTAANTDVFPRAVFQDGAAQAPLRRAPSGRCSIRRRHASRIADAGGRGRFSATGPNGRKR